MKNTVWIFLLFLLLLSCEEMNENMVESRADLKPQIEFKKVPDRIILNKEYNAELIYNSPLDTIEFKEEDQRFVVLYLTTEKGQFKGVEEIEKVNHRAFIYNDSLELFSFNFRFKDQQENTLKAIIKDQVILDNYYENGHSRIITNFTNIELDCNLLTAE